jgi:hypothetical protein
MSAGAPARAPPPSTVEVAGYGNTGGGGGGGGSAGWQVHYNESGKPYYFHPPSGRTQWEPPPGFR